MAKTVLLLHGADDPLGAGARASDRDRRIAGEEGGVFEVCCFGPAPGRTGRIRPRGGLTDD